MGFPGILGVMSVALMVLPAASCSRGMTSGAGKGDAAATSADWIESAACSGRPGCRLKSELWQTTDRGGSRAVVAVVGLAPAPAPRPGRYPFQDESTLPGTPIGHSWDGDDPTSARECLPWETWLISWTSTQAQRVRLLVSDCAADFGEAAPVVTDLGPDKVRYTRSDPLEGARSFDLSVDDPPRLERETRGGGEDHPLRERLRMDGMLTDWDGHVRQVEWAAGPSSRRFALKDGWPMPEDLWKLSYEDTDDGRKIDSRLAMSRTMQRPFVFVSSEACVLRDGVLHVDRDGATVPEKAIVW